MFRIIKELHRLVLETLQVDFSLGRLKWETSESLRFTQYLALSNYTKDCCHFLPADMSAEDQIHYISNHCQAGCLSPGLFNQPMSLQVFGQVSVCQCANESMYINENWSSTIISHIRVLWYTIHIYIYIYKYITPCKAHPCIYIIVLIYIYIYNRLSCCDIITYFDMFGIHLGNFCDLHMSSSAPAHSPPGDFGACDWPPCASVQSPGVEIKIVQWHIQKFSRSCR